MIPPAIMADFSAAEQLKVLQSDPLGGGCIHHAHRVITSKGSCFLKWNNLEAEENFEAEVKGLELLRNTKTVDIPNFVYKGKVGSYTYLVLEFIERSPKATNYWIDFGRNLAQMHSHSADHFGLDYDNFIGSLQQPNSPRLDWVSFFVECRIEPKLRQAVDQGHINMALIRSFDALFAKLETYFPEAIPALLHGDLWGGNILTGRRGQAIIFDPAVYYGHREMELAFMTLFDSQPPEFYDAYLEGYKLEPGWEDRFDLYNLYPLLVHVILFGNSYLSSVKRILQRFS